jgi:hypothetical protein
VRDPTEQGLKLENELATDDAARREVRDPTEQGLKQKRAAQVATWGKSRGA